MRIVATSLQPASGEDTAPQVFIVQLKDPAAAAHYAGTVLPGSSKTLGNKMSAPRAFSKLHADVQGYAQYLSERQDKVLSRAGPGVQKIYSYRYSLNGFAARMTLAQAQRMQHQPEVLRVWEDEIRPLATNFSPEFLGLFRENVGLRGAPGLDGDGIVIGVIDSGIAPEHPALTDTRPADRPPVCRSTWAESSFLGRWLCHRFSVQADVPDFEPLDDWNGICQAGDRFTEADCNNKLIGARFFVDGARESGQIDDGEIFSARDADGHGTHVATTAAGNKVKASIFGTFLGDVQGIAPRARIAVYKACWLRPGDTTASCNTSDLTNAIDTAVADGVDIINYSVGSSLQTVTAPDDLALMAAAKAGVLAVVAAGNEGPFFATIGSPAGAPWVLTAGASSREGEHSLEAMQIDAPASIAGKYAVREASFTPALKDHDPIEGALVLVDDDVQTTDDGAAGSTFDACQALVNDSEISGNIAFIQRGGCRFTTKIVNAQNAGAAAVVLFNIAGDPIVMTGTPGEADIPALMVGQADGNLILAEIDAGETVEVILDKGFFLSVADTGNVMGTFSSRGPAPVQDVLKPDVTAPGINILAGFTPDAANSVPDENFAFLTGTSMSTPHISGVAALLRQAHPEWSPAALKSALMTTAHQGVNQQDGSSPANPFDFGSGHIEPNAANDPGLVYDISDDEYDAFACDSGSPAVTQARCDALRDSGLSFEPSALNQPSIAVARLASTRTVSRRVTNVSDETGTYFAAVELPPDIDVQVVPSSLMIGPGQSQTFEVTFTFQGGPPDQLNRWRFGSLTWSSEDHAVRSVLAVRPVLVRAPVERFSSGGTGLLEFPVEFGYDGSYSPGVHGLDRASVIAAHVDNDPGRTFSFREENGVTAHVFAVPSNLLYFRFALFDQLTDGDDDLDLFLYHCPDSLLPLNEINCSKIDESGGPTSREQLDVLLPDAGTYIVFVHGFATDEVAGGPGANYRLLRWSLGLVNDGNDVVGDMTATGPGLVSAGTTHNVSVDWSGLSADSIFLGAVSHNTPQGLVAITLITIRN